ncbi:MAG: hypothetical protein CUN57_02865, partial [Phototrophicales bacterium]
MSELKKPKLKVFNEPTGEICDTNKVPFPFNHDTVQPDTIVAVEHFGVETHIKITSKVADGESYIGVVTTIENGNDTHGEISLNDKIILHKSNISF